MKITITDMIVAEPDNEIDEDDFCEFIAEVYADDLARIDDDEHDVVIDVQSVLSSATVPARRVFVDPCGGSEGEAVALALAHYVEGALSSEWEMFARYYDSFRAIRAHNSDNYLSR